MKTVIVILFFALSSCELLSFEKVWETKFDSIPHHIKYTKGHNELIVGENNIIKKYNPENGDIIDSISLDFSEFETYKVNQYEITDDFNYLYLLTSKNNFFYLIKYEIKTKTKKILYENEVCKSCSEIVYFRQINDSNYIIVFYDNSVFTIGTTYILSNDSITKLQDYNVYYLNVNTYFDSFYLTTLYVPNPKLGQAKYLENVWINKNLLYSFYLKNDVNILSKNNNYIYSLGNNKTTISKTNIYNYNSEYYSTHAKKLFAFKKDDEIIFQNSEKIYLLNISDQFLYDSLEIDFNNDITITNYKFGIFTYFDYKTKILLNYKTSATTNVNPNNIVDKIIVAYNQDNESMSIKSNYLFNNVKVFNIYGVMLKHNSTEVYNNETQFDINKLSNGCYFVELYKDSNLLSIEKIIISK